MEDIFLVVSFKRFLCFFFRFNIWGFIRKFTNIYNTIVLPRYCVQSSLGIVAGNFLAGISISYVRIGFGRLYNREFPTEQTVKKSCLSASCSYFGVRDQVRSSFFLLTYEYLTELALFIRIYRTLNTLLLYRTRIDRSTITFYIFNNANKRTVRF